VGERHIILPAPPLKRDNRYQQDKKRKRCPRRAAIEPIIRHLKSDFRLVRNFLKGVIGDCIKVLMAAMAWNFSLWMRLFFVLMRVLKIQTHNNLRQKGQATAIHQAPA
jgi:IS5 family transposase